MKHLLEIIGDFMIIGYGLTTSVIFGRLLLEGPFDLGSWVVYEPNPYILWTEVILGPALVAFGIYHLREDTRRQNGRDR